MHRPLLIALIIVAALPLIVLFLPERSIDERLPASAASPIDIPPVDENRYQHRPSHSSVPVVSSEDARAEPATTAECPQKKLLEVTTESEEARKARALLLARELAQTSDAEYLLAAALLSQFDAPGVPLELLETASRIAPSHPLIVWDQLSMCRVRKGASCNFSEIEANAIRVDGGNGAIWMEIAMLRLAGDQPEKAAQAVRRAIAAPRFDSYFIENTMVLERALAARSDSSYRDRVFEGFGYSAALAISYYRVTKHCRNIDSNDGVWLELCNQLGEQMFAKGRSLLDQAVGNSLQKIVAGHGGDDARIAATIGEETQFRKRYQKLIGNREAQGLLENDEAALREYVENFATYGELEAQTRLNVEVERLKGRPDYDQCNFVPHRTIE